MQIKNSKEISAKITSLAFGVLVLSFLVGFYAVATWTEPSSPPPESNTSAPINVGSDLQTKTGALIINSGGADTGLQLLGKVSIGTIGIPTEALEVNGNIKLANGPLPSSLLPFYRMVNVADPVDNFDVVNKQYVDDLWGPSDVKATLATHDGNFGGYDGMYNWIQINGCAGYHLCTLGEVIAWAQRGNDPSSVDGAYFATDVTYTTYVPNCDSFTASNDHCYILSAPNSVSPFKVAARWVQNGCLTARHVACCK